MDINQVLETAPQKIYEYATEEIRFLEQQMRLHEEYKLTRAKKGLELKAQGTSLKEIDWLLDSDDTLLEMKSNEMTAEISYKKQRALKDRADDYLQVALEKGRSQRAEIRAGLDVVTEK